MAMCNTTESYADALITAQNHGPVLAMVAWFLACLLALCTAIRAINRCRSQRLRQLPISDDIILVAASLCGIGAAVVISTAVDSGLGKRKCLLTSMDMDQLQIKVFVSTILFVLALSISKCSIIIFLHRLADNTLQRVGVMFVGILVVVWTLAVMTGIVFECNMPRPWEIWTGQCIPMLPFWITATAIDILIDLTLIILSTHTIWSTLLTTHQKSLTTLLLSLRFLLIASSSIRLTYLHPAFSRTNTDPTFSSIPYHITTQAHTTLSILLALILLTPSYPRPEVKHWSGTTIGGTPYESHNSFTLDSKARIVREPLGAIQRSMSSPATSRHSLDDDVLLPDSPPARKSPRRPPPPRDEERPDLSMFRQKTVIRQPPLVTRLGDSGIGKGVVRGKSLQDRGLV